MISLEYIILITLLFVVLIYSLWPSKFRYHRFVSYFILPVVLLCSWIGLLLYQSYQIEKVASILTNEYSVKKIIQKDTGELLQGEKIIGEFVSRDNYLGIIGVRFHTFYRLNSDYLIFRIKESGSSQWWYQNRYKEDQFQPEKYFTFGFPAIKNSKGKTYIFELESESGRPGNAVSLSRIEPSFIAKHKYPKEEIMASTGNIVLFAGQKVANLARSTSFRASSFVYLLPFFLHLLSLTPRWGRLFELIYRNKRIISLFILSAGSVVDALYVTNSDITTLVILILWLGIIRNYYIKSKFFFLVSLCLLGTAWVLYYLENLLLAEALASWTWIYLALSCFQLTLHHISNRQP